MKLALLLATFSMISLHAVTTVSLDSLRREYQPIRKFLVEESPEHTKMASDPLIQQVDSLLARPGLNRSDLKQIRDKVVALRNELSEEELADVMKENEIAPLRNEKISDQRQLNLIIDPFIIKLNKLIGS